MHKEWQPISDTTKSSGPRVDLQRIFQVYQLPEDANDYPARERVAKELASDCLVLFDEKIFIARLAYRIGCMPVRPYASSIAGIIVDTMYDEFIRIENKRGLTLEEARYLKTIFNYRICMIAERHDSLLLPKPATIENLPPQDKKAKLQNVDNGNVELSKEFKDDLEQAMRRINRKKESSLDSLDRYRRIAEQYIAQQQAGILNTIQEQADKHKQPIDFDHWWFHLVSISSSLPGHTIRAFSNTLTFVTQCIIIFTIKTYRFIQSLDKEQKKYHR